MDRLLVVCFLYDDVLGVLREGLKKGCFFTCLIFLLEHSWALEGSRAEQPWAEAVVYIA